ncbi:glucose-1-phosphate thymidylyltransferase [Maricaulis maris]|nr:glucose-1-phosphate thymidylyltransferase [Maricaulis maris]
MIYYPLSALMLAGIRQVEIITTPRDEADFRKLLGDGSQLGMKLSYVVQTAPRGIADAFILCRDFIGDSPVTLILGDNLFYGHGLSELLHQSVSGSIAGATIFSYHVNNPRRYGVVSVDKSGRATALVEKPQMPKSNLAVTGLYVYDNTVVDRVRVLSPSARNELEITDLNKLYLQDGSLRVVPLGRGVAWLDTGTAQSLLEASEFVRSLQRRQGLQIACIEEIAYRQGWIGSADLDRAAKSFESCDYGKYLDRLPRVSE